MSSRRSPNLSGVGVHAEISREVFGNVNKLIKGLFHCLPSRNQQLDFKSLVGRLQKSTWRKHRTFTQCIECTTNNEGVYSGELLRNKNRKLFGRGVPDAVAGLLNSHSHAWVFAHMPVIFLCCSIVAFPVQSGPHAALWDPPGSPAFTHSDHFWRCFLFKESNSDGGSDAATALASSETLQRGFYRKLPSFLPCYRVQLWLQSVHVGYHSHRCMKLWCKRAGCERCFRPHHGGVEWLRGAGVGRSEWGYKMDKLRRRVTSPTCSTCSTCSKCRRINPDETVVICRVAQFLSE